MSKSKNFHKDFDDSDEEELLTVRLKTDKFKQREKFRYEKYGVLDEQIPTRKVVKETRSTS